MKLNDDLEEIFTLAYVAEPNKTEYYLTRILIRMPQIIESEPLIRGHHEYEEDRPATYTINSDKHKLANFIAKLRHSRI